MAKHDLTDINVPLGVKVIGMLGCQVRRLKYVSGAAPTRSSGSTGRESSRRASEWSDSLIRARDSSRSGC